MQYGLKILGTGGYVPPLTVSNEEFAAIADTSDEWIRSRTGIGERHFADGESSLDLAAQAAHRAMDDAGAAPEQIGVVVCATATHEYLFPSLACRVAQALGLSEQVLAFDLNAACSGFLFALHTAQCLLGERRDAYALVIGSEVLSRITDFEDRSTCILFGDGAGAVVAGLGDGGPTLFDSGAIGGTQVLSCPSGLTARNPFASVQELPQRPRIHMDGREVFRFAVDSVSASITRTLAQGGLAPGDVDWYVCHQANQRILKAVAKRLDIPLERFFCNIGHRGNTSAASIPLALDELHRSGLLRRGQRVVLSGFGGGLTYGSLYFIW